MGWPQWVVALMLVVNALGAVFGADARDSALRIAGSALMGLLLDAGGFWS